MRTVPTFLALALAAGHASAEATWITAGDAAYKVIRKAYPNIKPRETRPGMAGAEKAVATLMYAYAGKIPPAPAKPAPTKTN